MNNNYEHIKLDTNYVLSELFENKSQLLYELALCILRGDEVEAKAMLKEKRRYVLNVIWDNLVDKLNGDTGAAYDLLCSVLEELIEEE